MWELGEASGATAQSGRYLVAVVRLHGELPARALDVPAAVRSASEVLEMRVIGRPPPG